MAWPVSAFPTGLDSITDKVDSVDEVVANDINGVYDCIEHIEAKIGIDGSAVTSSLDYLLKNSSSVDPGHKHSSTWGAAGTKMVFYQDTAPSGWTIDTTLDDKLLFITKGSGAGGQTGGGAHSSGTWTQPTHTHTGPSHTHTGPSHTHSGPSHTHTVEAHTHTTGDHAITTNEMPSHRHSGLTIDLGFGVPGGTGYSFPSGYTGYDGGGAVHNHGATGSDGDCNTGSGGTGDTGAGGTGATGASGTDATGASSTVNTWRPAAYCAIICTKS